MGISVSSVGSSVNFAPALELTKTQASQRQSVEQFEASLPGSSGQKNNTPQELNHLAADFEHVSLAFNKKLQFVVDQQSHEVLVKVIDKSTDKVIKVLPPEELQRLHRKLVETIGFLFNEEV